MAILDIALKQFFDACLDCGFFKVFLLPSADESHWEIKEKIETNSPQGITEEASKSESEN